MRKAVTAKTPTSSAGSDRRRAGGYTLAELLVVLAIMAGLLTLIPPLFDRGLSNTEMRSAARQMMASLRYARSEAVSRREPVSFLLDLEQRRYHVPGQRPVALPGGLELTLKTAVSEVRGQDRGTITFFSDGSASGGNLTLVHPENPDMAMRLDVDWLSGRVSLHE